MNGSERVTGFMALRFLPAVLVIAVLAWVTVPVAHDAELSPEANYMLHCSGCHLPDGSGNPPDVPDAREMGRMLAVAGGREYLVQVPGSSQAMVSDQAVADVVNYMLETFSAEALPADYRPLTAREVGEWRTEWMPDPAAVRQQLMDAAERTSLTRE